MTNIVEKETLSVSDFLFLKRYSQQLIIHHRLRHVLRTRKMRIMIITAETNKSLSAWSATGISVSARTNSFKDKIGLW